MLGFLGSLLGGASSIFGSILGSNSQQAANSANIAEQQYLDTHHIQDVVADANAAGINPLAALGVNTPSAPVQVGSNFEGIGKGGQDIGRAVSALGSPEDKTSALNAELLKAQIAKTNSEVTAQQLQNSKFATTLAATGSPPGLRSVPLPRPSPFTDDTLPLYQDYRDRHGGRITLLSPDAQRSVFSGVPGAPTWPAIAGGLIGENIPNAGNALIPVRPDVSRAIGNADPERYYSPF